MPTNRVELSACPVTARPELGIADTSWNARAHEAFTRTLELPSDSGCSSTVILCGFHRAVGYTALTPLGFDPKELCTYVAEGHPRAGNREPTIPRRGLPRAGRQNLQSD